MAQTDRLRVAYLSHSLVADRQAAFAQALRLQGTEVLELYPAKWGRLERPGGWEGPNAGNMVEWVLPGKAWQSLLDWHPDVLLVQQEAYCLVMAQARNFCGDHKVPLVTFSWENLHPPGPYEMLHLGSAALNIFGNADAQRLAHDAGVRTPSAILPQVGLDPEAFRPDPTTPLEHDIGFFGRAGDPMKGEAVLDKAAQGQGWRVWKKHEAGFFPYEELAAKYRACIVQCVPSLDAPGRPREQFAPAVTIEGLMAGVPVVTTDQAAIFEWTRMSPYLSRPCPAAWWAQAGNAESLRGALHSAILDWVNDPVKFREKGLAGRAWAVEHFSNERVAREYVQALKGAVEGDL